MKPVLVKTPSRLHFGLLGWGPQSYRQFGGFGLMIDEPGIELLIEPAETWQAVGEYSERCLEVGQALASHFSAIQPCRIEVCKSPREHVGLGVGTQLTLGVARGLTTAFGLEGLTASDLALTTGRGLRSGVGIHGFERGGMIVDAGRRHDHQTPTLINALPFPEEWAIFRLTPKASQGLHGSEEVGAFQQLVAMPGELTDRLCRLLLLQAIPAVIERDLPAFGDALSEIQKAVGSAFAPVQGGAFGSRETEKWTHAFEEVGLHGVGQSSWGPTLYGFLDKTRGVAPHEVLAKLQDRPGADRMEWIVTKASRSGAITNILPSK